MAGIRAVFITEGENVVAGLRCTAPWIFFSPGVGVVCERCGVTKAPIAPPASAGLNGGPQPLFGVQTRDYALYLLSHQLYPFHAAHKTCAAKEEKS